MFGGDGWDDLSGDNGRFNARVSGEDNDRLSGGPGQDVLYVGDGQDTLTGAATVTRSCSSSTKRRTLPLSPISTRRRTSSPSMR
ncbi:hypothetical protein NLY34_00025 [Mesorhizobium sp. C374B]|uniref:hypothetical protein n=1 Tax=Mesorhizobium sp. C374B TaxID=2956830 RepID=UPI002577AC75|nr:hypothetical protein [Mesorhizobium sp. C374B]WJI84389.1 hypothetical protein NLY34_00025 [Mesorhizobium sp. C374B]